MTNDFEPLTEEELKDLELNGQHVVGFWFSAFIYTIRHERARAKKTGLELITLLGQAGELEQANRDLRNEIVKTADAYARAEIAEVRADRAEARVLELEAILYRTHPEGIVGAEFRALERARQAEARVKELETKAHRLVKTARDLADVLPGTEVGLEELYNALKEWPEVA